MERETKVIKTPIGNHEVVLKVWLTAREKRDVMSVYLTDTQLKDDQTYSISAMKYFEAQNKTLESVIVSIDGDDKNLCDRCLDMRSEDFDFIIEEINKLNNVKTEEEKK